MGFSLYNTPSATFPASPVSLASFMAEPYAEIVFGCTNDGKSLALFGNVKNFI
jgi:hypothetical protein